jgi:hypothetical protein
MYFLFFQEFLSKYADDRGLTFEFSHITECFQDQEFLSPENLTLPSTNLDTNNQANLPSELFTELNPNFMEIDSLITTTHMSLSPSDNLYGR